MLNPDIEATASLAGHALDEMLAAVNSQSAELVLKPDIPVVVAYFAELRDKIDDLARKAGALKAHVETLSRETIPTLFANSNVKTIKIEGVGRATVNVHWSASPVDKEAAFGWCRQTGNGSLIIETINSQTLGAFAKAEALAGRPLPSDLFKVSTSSFISITKE